MCEHCGFLGLVGGATEQFMWVLCMYEGRVNVNVPVSVCAMRLGVCEDKCTGAELVLFDMLDTSGSNHNKDTVYDSCARKCKFSIIMKALIKVE